MFILSYAIPLLMLFVMVVKLIRELRAAYRRRAEMTNNPLATVSPIYV